MDPVAQLGQLPLQTQSLLLVPLALAALPLPLHRLAPSALSHPLHLLALAALLLLLDLLGQLVQHLVPRQRRSKSALARSMRRSGRW